MENNENSAFLGEAKLSGLMLKFSIPCILSLLVSALYNIVDQIFIGNSELSALGNAATGIVFPIFIIAQAFAWCFGDGCAAYLNICQGRQDTQNAHKAVGSGITVTLICSLLLLAIFYPFKTQLLFLFGASENSIGMATEYFNIILAFFPVYMLMNMMNAVVRADGSPSWSMASMLTGALINIALDPLFIFGFHWGMAGAAWATIIGQIVSFIISLLYFFRTKTFKLHARSFLPDFRVFGQALQLGASSFITQMTIVIISLVCNIMLAHYGALSKYGVDIPIAVIGIESKVFTVVINLVVGIVLGCQPIIGYNYGARKFARVREVYRRILTATICIGLVSTLIFECFPRAVVGIFGSPTNLPNPEDYWEFSALTFRIFLSLVTFTCIIKMTSIFFQAVGKPGRAVISSLTRDIVCFVPLILILPRFFGIRGILFAAPAADLIAMVVAMCLTAGFLRSLHAEEVTPAADETVLRPSKPGMILTVSREHGTRGKQIGKRVAELLGIPFYYKEMTALAAQESGLNREFISGINANSPAAMHELYLSTNAVQQAVAAQSHIIRRIAENGSCVIVGRAADYVLRETPNVAHIFLYAPKEYRAKQIAAMYGDSEADALRQLRRADAARAAYYHSISGLDWGDMHHYDLCIDTSAGVEHCAGVICEYLKCR